MSFGTIKAIENISNITIEEITNNDEYRSVCWEGYKITLQNPEDSIHLVISNHQTCCEDWGYFSTNDKIEDFAGCELIDVKIVDTDLNVIEKHLENGLWEGKAMFINLETNKGLLQFVLYNHHHGYYGHEAVVWSEKNKEIAKNYL